MTRPTTAQLNAAYDQFNFWYDKAKKLDEELAKAEQRIAELEASASVKAVLTLKSEISALHKKIATPVRLPWPVPSLSDFKTFQSLDELINSSRNSIIYECAAAIRDAGFDVERP